MSNKANKISKGFVLCQAVLRDGIVNVMLTLARMPASAAAHRARLFSLKTFCVRRSSKTVLLRKSSASVVELYIELLTSRRVVRLQLIARFVVVTVVCH